MTKEEAIKIIKKNMPSKKSLPVYEALETLIPELTESEDESTPSIWITVIWVIIAFMETYECYKRQKGSE